MKTFSLAAVSSVLLFGSSIASAGPRFGPEPFRDFDRYPHHHHHGRPFAVPFSPLARILPVVVPPPAFVTPRREVPVSRPVSSPAPTPVVTVPSAPAPPSAPVTPQPTTNPKPNKPQPPSGQGNGGNKPPKPAR